MSDTKYSNPQLASEFFRRSYALIPLREMKKLPINYKAYGRVMLRNMLLYPKKQHHNYMGYFNARAQKLAKANPKMAIQRHYMQNDTMPYPFSQNSLQHLDSIIHFCESNQIELLLVSSPLHQDYIGLVPSSYKDKYKAVSQKITARGVKIFDFQYRPLPDSHFSDHDHLSRMGADSLSSWLSEAIN